jgi:3-deoxy-D-manno-octulosonate 8-phosphate phosphatase (KDO 8-P phosphatase)
MKFSDIKVVVTDVDGCLTDGHYVITSAFEDANSLMQRIPYVSKSFHTRDFDGLERTMKTGIRVIIISQSKDSVIAEQINRLTMRSDSFWSDCYKNGFLRLLRGVEDKKQELDKYLAEEKISWDNVAYFGDAENDLESIEQSLYAGCPNDAVDIIKKNCNYWSSSPGGRGVVYDFCMFILRQIETERSKNENFRA